jgi:hypothetical protein
VGGSWVHQLHEASLPLLGFGWASLAAAHGWNRLRHRGGGLPWVMNVLWLSTWVMVGSTVVVGLEEGLLGHEDEVGGINWPHLVQQGLTASYLALLAVSAGWAFGWWRVDVSGTAARVLKLPSGQMARSIGQMLNLALGVGLVAAVAVIVINVR